MNEVELLANSLGFPDLIESNRDQINSTVRQAISYYLKKLNYKEKDIAIMQKKDRTTIYHHIKTFQMLLEVRDPIAVKIWSKFGMDHK